MKGLNSPFQGTKVMHISACALGESINAGQAYIVIEKEVE